MIYFALLAGLMLMFSVSAGKGSPTPLRLVHDGNWNGPTRYYDSVNPETQCLGEDNSWLRIWDGDMFAGQVLQTSIWKCHTGTAGFRVANQVWRGDTNVVVVSPSGIIYTLHDLGIIDHKHEYLRCFNEPRNGTPAPAGVGLEAGKWTITLTAVTAAKRIRFTVDGDMSWPEWQVANCIPEDYETADWPCWPYYKC